MPGPTRILHLVRGLDIGRHSGGAELHAARVCLNLDETRFTARIFALGSYGTEVERKWVEVLGDSGIDVDFGLPWKSIRSPNLGREFIKLWSVIGSYKPQITHSHSERCDLLNALTRMLHPHHRRALRTVHLYTQWQSRPRVGAFVDDVVVPFTFAGEIAVSRAIKDRLTQKRARKDDRVWLCYNGMDPSILEESTIDSGSLPIGVPTKGPRIMTIGRLTEQKNHRLLLQALKIVNERLPANLLIVGDGPLKSALHKQCQALGLEDHVSFLGLRSDVAELLACADLFVLPSLWEGFPTVLLEAMAKRVPVVATDISGSRELVNPGQTGWLVPPGNADQLARAMIEALTSKQKAVLMAQRARKLAETYTIQQTAKCYANVYASTMQRREL